MGPVHYFAQICFWESSNKTPAQHSTMQKSLTNDKTVTQSDSAWEGGGGLQCGLWIQQQLCDVSWSIEITVKLMLIFSNTQHYSKPCNRKDFFIIHPLPSTYPQGASWTGCRFVTGLTQRDRRLLTPTFTPTPNLESAQACFWTVRGSQSARACKLRPGDSFLLWAKSPNRHITPLPFINIIKTKTCWASIAFAGEYQLH